MIMKKYILVLIILIPVSVAALGLFSMSRGDIEDAILCATHDESHYIPSSVCEYYLRHFRMTKEDVRYLEDRAGLAFLFGISDRSQRGNLMSSFLAHGLSINRPSAIDGYPPLHAAIINNDPELVEFLLAHGADLEQKDNNNHQTAAEFVRYLDGSTAPADRHAIKELLSAYKH